MTNHRAHTKGAGRRASTMGCGPDEKSICARKAKTALTGKPKASVSESSFTLTPSRV